MREVLNGQSVYNFRDTTLAKPAGKVFMPAAIYEFPDVIANNELFGEAGLGAGVDDDWCGIGEMMAEDSGVSGVDVVGRFKTRPGGPEKIGR